MTTFRDDTTLASVETDLLATATDFRGVDLISDALPFGRLWYGEPNAIGNAVDYARFRSRSCRAVIRVYDDARNVIETQEHAGRFQISYLIRARASGKPKQR